MVKTCDSWEPNHLCVRGRPILRTAANRRIAKAGVHPILVVVVLDVLAKESPQVPLVHHDPVIESLTPHRSDPSLSDPVLPGTSVGGPPGFDSEMSDGLDDAIREEGVVVVDQEREGVLVGKRLTELLDRPR